MNAHKMTINQTTCINPGVTASGNPNPAGMPVQVQRSWYCSIEMLIY